MKTQAMIRQGLLGGAFLSLFLLASAWPANAEPTRRALLVGIDQYLAPGVSDLAGCGNDVDLMRNVLIQRFEVEPENILVLKDEQATRNGILEAIQSHLITPSKEGDIAIFHYSGHGSRMIDTSGDELDNFDETIVPHDSRQGEVFDISDDELNGLMGKLSDKTPHVTFVLDSCHSGSAVRAAAVGNRVRQVDPDKRMPPVSELAPAGRGLTEGPDDFRLPGAEYVLISGSRANELSNETSFDGRRHGALTYFLADALTNAGELVTYREIMEDVSSEVTVRFPAQHPQVEGTGLDKVFFGIDNVLSEPFVLVEPHTSEPEEATVQAGEIYGLVPGAELDVFPARTRDFDDPSAAIAEVRVSSVGTFTSQAEVTEGAVEPHSRAQLGVIRPPESSVGVFFAGTSGVIQAAKVGLEEHESVEVVANREDAQIRVREDEGEVILEGRDLETLSRVAGADLAEKTIERISHWGRWFSILAIDNPSPQLEIDLQLRRTDGGLDEPPLTTVTVGTPLTLEVTNLSDREVHVVVLDLASDGSVGILYPPGNTSDPLPPGKTASRNLGVSSLDQKTSDFDYVKAIATTEAIPISVFKLGPVARNVAPAPRAEESSLERFLRGSVQGLTRKLDPVDLEGWVVEQKLLRVHVPRVATDGFLAHFDTEDEATRGLAALGGTRAICDDLGGVGCYEMKQLPGDSTMVKVSPPAVRSGQRDLSSVGRSFEEAYELQSESGALRVEPLLEYEVPRAQTAPHLDSPEARGLGSDEPDARAVANQIWSLEYVRVPEAWQLVRGRTGRTAGSEADGVVVAHPDTGYVRHPEIWHGPEHLPAWPEKGYDYFGSDDDPTDDLLDRRLLDNPAHGTGSSSAIVSPAGCQLTGALKCPTGAAQGARLVPLRLGRSVVQFSTERMTQAILDASGGDRTRVKVASDVMSIAMGGAPSWSLWKAVRKAEDRGYLIVAAAGNYVRTVVWPARYDSVVAVAAVNAGCRPWKHSSRGSAVDFSAPGESVWRATLGDDGSFVTGMGTGTTYATSSTAGIAALWVAHHKGTPAFEELKRRGEVTGVFRDLVQRTSWQPGTAAQPSAATCDSGVEWKEGRFGTGIIDAAALLAQPLPGSRSTRGRIETSITDLPLWASLYPEDSDLSVAHTDYRHLFALDAEDSLESVAIFEAEVLYHYATDERFAVAVDEIVVTGNRGEAAYDLAVEALRDGDLSPRLRAALKGSG